MSEEEKAATEAKPAKAKRPSKEAIAHPLRCQLCQSPDAAPDVAPVLDAKGEVTNFPVHDKCRLTSALRQRYIDRGVIRPKERP